MASTVGATSIRSGSSTLAAAHTNDDYYHDNDDNDDDDEEDEEDDDLENDISLLTAAATKMKNESADDIGLHDYSFISRNSFTSSLSTGGRMRSNSLPIVSTSSHFLSSSSSRSRGEYLLCILLIYVCVILIRALLKSILMTIIFSLSMILCCGSHF